jgi:hypothetical protein
MNKILLVLAVALVVFGVVGVSFAIEPGGLGYPCNGDPWNMNPPPSGMRFTPAGGGPGMPCNAPYNYCWAQGGCAICAHWTQYSWYAQWGYGKGGYGGDCGGNCGPGGCPDGSCGGDCVTDYMTYKKHQWLH